MRIGLQLVLGLLWVNFSTPAVSQGQPSAVSENSQPGLAAARTGAPKAVLIVDKEFGLEATVIVLPPEENRGFRILDVPQKKRGDTIQAHWSTNFVVMCNGGFFFTSNFNPAAYCRIDGKSLNETVSTRWSGLVAMDGTGKIHLLWRGDDLTRYPSVVQTGPYVIDPGGKIGIYSRVEKARRTLIGLTAEKELIIMATKEIDLYDLAYAVKKLMPRVERLLNLDGGPSSAFKTATVEILNEWPVRNYIAK